MKKWISIVAIFTLLSFSGCASAEERILSPEEIPLAESEAGMLSALELFFGTENGMELEQNVTRAEAVVMAERISVGQSSESVRRFTDVPAGHWAEKQIHNACAKQIIAGTGDGKFEPDRNVTGEEFAVMLLKEMGYSAVTTGTAYKKGLESGLLLNNFTKTVVKENRQLSRSDAVRLCYDALFAQNAAGQAVKDALIETGIFTEEKFYEVTTCGLPAPETASFAEKISSVMPAGSNYMFSPLSIKMALAMAANGANESVKAEILELLDIADLEQFNQNAKAWIEKYEKQTAVELSIANSIWLNEDVAFLGKSAVFDPLFEQIIQDSYFGAVRRTSNEKAVGEVNAWTSEKTKGKIDKIISGADFTALLANAVYFKADWSTPFNPQKTSPAMFTNADGTTTETDFMHDMRHVQYYHQNGIEMVRLPYKNTKIAMYFMLTPTEQPNFENVIRNAYMENKEVILSIPKFESDFFIDLTGPIKDLGVRQAFEDGDPFPKMVIGEPLKINEILHKTYIKVEEQGTEAAAVTVVAMAETGNAPREEPIYFTADRPFTYVIRDEDNKETLFAGRYAFAK